MKRDLQLVSQGDNQEVVGPFGRAVVGECPIKGTMSIIGVAVLFDFVSAGGCISLLILAIITTYLSI